MENNSQRGVINPRIIDLIHPDNDCVVLSIFEDRPWSNQKEQLEQLQNKFNNYLDYVLDGYFEEQYPQYKNTTKKIELVCKYKPDGMAYDLINSMSDYMKSISFEFEVTVKDFVL